MVAEIEEAVALAKEYNKKYCIDPKEIYWFAFEKWQGTAERLLDKVKVLTNYENRIE